MATEAEGARSARLFFALWLPAGVARSLHCVADGVVGRCGGRLLNQDSFHLTLAFLGDVPERRQPELQIHWAGSREPEPVLLALAATLQKKLLAADFLTETRPLLPHVTLVRKLLHPDVLPDLGPFEWSAGELVLARSCRSDRGAEYETMARWPLA